ncbi:hypothetical protein NIES2104_59730 [Leptolyngbya sp. NIES-2104]|nr:hypothetical protein NIES2104_59730 [Leptolyngbya sp. NIES-2104]
MYRSFAHKIGCDNRMLEKNFSLFDDVEIFTKIQSFPLIPL